MSHELAVISGHDLLDARLSNENDFGWHFGAGDPELFHYADRLVTPGGKVLDIGMGYGRNAFFFALHGMEVVGIDDNVSTVESVNECVEALRPTLPLKMAATCGDAVEADLPTGEYDVALASNLIHMPSRQATLRVLDKAYDSLKPGGHLWMRLLGEEASGSEDLVRAIGRHPMVRHVDEGVIEHPCSCSGQRRLDTTVFFEQTAVLAHFAHKGGRIIDSQVSPTVGQQNIMFGEDYNPGTYVYRGGMISLLVEKTA